MNELSFRGATSTMGTAPPPSMCEEAWILGQPPTDSYLDFVEEMAVGTTLSKRELVDEWRAANDHYFELEQTEAGAADKIGCRALPSVLAPLAAELKADAKFALSFDTMPTSIEMVEIERLVLFQNHVSRHYVEKLKAELGPRPAPETLFRFCLPLGTPRATVEARQISSRRFAFTSDSLDFRSHDPVLLRPDQLVDHTSFGAIGGIVAMIAGFSSNFLSAVRSDKRLILHNGYHRACALLELGIKYAPVIIETVTRRDELNLIAKRRVVDDPGFYLTADRPPLLKDFINPRLRKVFQTRKVRRVVEIEIEVHDHNVPE